MKDLSQLHQSLDKATMGALPVRQLVAATTTDFDLFITITGSLHLYAHAPYAWTQGEIERLLARGIELLFYSISDRTKVEAYGQLSKLAGVCRAAEPGSRLGEIITLAGDLNKILYHFPLDGASFARIRDLGEIMVDTILEDPTCIGALGKLSQHDHYTYVHRGRVAAYAVALAVHQSLKARAELIDLAVGCLLHDIGKASIDLAILNKAGALDPKEWQLMQTHPALGEQMVASSHLTLTGKSIIIGHHERLDGKGYPYGLGRHEIMFEVRIAAFADVFDALTTNRPYQASRSRFEALSLIQHKLLEGLDKEIFRSLIAIFDPKRLAP